MTDIASSFDLSKIPSRASVGYVDAEIADEGQKVIMSNGDQVEWSAPAPRPIVPDWSQIKSIRHYFGRTGHQVWPAWFYHKTEAPRLMKDGHQARAELGIFYREASVEERGRYGVKAVWDWDDGCEWRAAPWEKPKFDPANPGSGKTYMPSAPNPVHAQNALLAELIPTVVAAVTTALKSNGPAAPATVDPAQWDAFLQFQAWQKTQEAVNAVAAQGADEAASDEQTANALNALTPEQDWALWEEEAKRKEIKVDKRWSLERLKTEVQKAA